MQGIVQNTNTASMLKASMASMLTRAAKGDGEGILEDVPKVIVVESRAHARVDCSWKGITARISRASRPR